MGTRRQRRANLARTWLRLYLATNGAFGSGGIYMRRVLVFLVAITCAGSALAQTSEGRLKKIDETNVVKLAYRSDANPFSFVNEQGQPDGYTIDLCKFVVHSLELQLKAKLTIAWVPAGRRPE